MYLALHVETQFSRTVVLASLVARHGNSSSVIWKLDRITYFNMFCFHFCALQFINSVTVKSSIIHVLTLYLLTTAALIGVFTKVEYLSLFCSWNIEINSKYMTSY
jgi:hypothetical protein